MLFSQFGLPSDSSLFLTIPFWNLESGLLNYVPPLGSGFISAIPLLVALSTSLASSPVPDLNDSTVHRATKTKFLGSRPLDSELTFKYGTRKVPQQATYVIMIPGSRHSGKLQKVAITPMYDVTQGNPARAKFLKVELAIM